MFTVRAAVPIAILVFALAVAACSSDAPTSTPSPTATLARDTSTPSPTPPPSSLYPGYDLALQTGTFWEYRWSYEDRSCAQGSGCNTKADEGTFAITLGAQTTIQGVPLYTINVSGKTNVSIQNEFRDFAPRWRYIGVNDERILVSNGASLVTLFDARTGRWAGSGFFTERFANDELVAATTATINDSHEFSTWPGFLPGPAQSVGRSDSQSQCEVIAGERICPREESFSGSEREFYRAGVGPLAYAYDFSASFSGGGFFSSTSTKERLALVGSSLRGDNADVAPTRTPTTPPATVEVEPNDTPSTAQVITKGVPLSGDIMIGDVSDGPEVTVPVDDRVLVVAAEDHYIFDLAQPSSIRAELTLDGPSRIGLLLWDNQTGLPIAFAFPDSLNPTIITDLPSGTYRLGVTAIDTPSGRVRYSIAVSLNNH